MIHQKISNYHFCSKPWINCVLTTFMKPVTMANDLNLSMSIQICCNVSLYRKKIRYSMYFVLSDGLKRPWLTYFEWQVLYSTTVWRNEGRKGWSWTRLSIAGRGDGRSRTVASIEFIAQRRICRKFCERTDGTILSPLPPLSQLFIHSLCYGNTTGGPRTQDQCHSANFVLVVNEIVQS